MTPALAPLPRGRRGRTLRDICRSLGYSHAHSARMGVRLRELPTRERGLVQAYLRGLDDAAVAALEGYRSPEAARRALESVMRELSCPRCERVSWHPEDVRNRYCSACHETHESKEL